MIDPSSAAAKKRSIDDRKKEATSSRTPSPYLLLSLASLFWSGNHIVGRAIAGHVPPFAISTLRWLLPACVLWFFAKPYILRDWPVIAKNWRILLFLGMTGGAIFTAGQYIGLQYTTALNVSVLNSISPVLIVLTSAILFRDQLTLIQGFGIATSLSGVLAIVSRGDLAALSELRFNYGDIIIFFNMALIAVYSSVLRLAPPLHWLSFIFLLSLISAACLLPFAAWEHLSGLELQFTLLTFLAIVYVSVFPSVISYVAWSKGVESIGANRAGPFLHLIPLYSAIFAYSFLGEKLLAYHVLGFVLIIAGVWTASHSGRSNVEP